MYREYKNRSSVRVFATAQSINALCALPHGALLQRAAHCNVLAPENGLLALLSKRQRQQVWAQGEEVDLSLGEALCRPGDTIGHAYFPSTSFISLVSKINDEPALEVGMVGREGMLGVQLVLGIVEAPLHAIVQGAGAALRVSTAAFQSEVDTSKPLRALLNRYVHVLMQQLATSAACTRFHQVEQRMARWLLMSQDRAHGDQFQLTHEFLAYMLGVRRVGITRAAGSLAARGLIHYHRGHVTVLDRKGLQESACSCYASDRAAYTRVFPHEI